MGVCIKSETKITQVQIPCVLSGREAKVHVVDNSSLLYDQVNKREKSEVEISS